MTDERPTDFAKRKVDKLHKQWPWGQTVKFPIVQYLFLPFFFQKSNNWLLKNLFQSILYFCYSLHKSVLKHSASELDPLWCHKEPDSLGRNRIYLGGCKQRAQSGVSCRSKESWLKNDLKASMICNIYLCMKLLLYWDCNTESNQSFEIPPPTCHGASQSWLLSVCPVSTCYECVCVCVRVWAETWLLFTCSWFPCYHQAPVCHRPIKSATIFFPAFFEPTSSFYWHQMIFNWLPSWHSTTTRSL